MYWCNLRLENNKAPFRGGFFHSSPAETPATLFNRRMVGFFFKRHMTDIINFEVERIIREILKEPKSGMIIIRIEEDGSPYAAATMDDDEVIEHLRAVIKDYQSNTEKDVQFTPEF